MSERVPPTTREVIAGVFLLLFGAVFLLAGGACTAFWIFAMTSSGSGAGLLDSLPMLAIALVTAGFGLLALKGAVSCFRSKAPPEPPAP
jgi:hypothetical protein